MRAIRNRAPDRGAWRIGVMLLFPHDAARRQRTHPFQQNGVAREIRVRIDGQCPSAFQKLGRKYEFLSGCFANGCFQALPVQSGNTWHFGYKAHVGVDKDTGLVHHVEVTDANVHDVTMVAQLLTGTAGHLKARTVPFVPKR